MRGSEGLNLSVFDLIVALRLAANLNDIDLLISYYRRQKPAERLHTRYYRFISNPGPFSVWNSLSIECHHPLSCACLTPRNYQVLVCVVGSFGWRFSPRVHNRDLHTSRDLPIHIHTIMPLPGKTTAFMRRLHGITSSPGPVVRTPARPWTHCLLEYGCQECSSSERLPS